MNNTSTGHISFKLNNSYHLCVSNEKDVNPYLKSKSVDEGVNNFRKFITVHRQNLQHT